MIFGTPASPHAHPLAARICWTLFGYMPNHGRLTCNCTCLHSAQCLNNRHTNRYTHTHAPKPAEFIQWMHRRHLQVEQQHQHQDQWPPNPTAVTTTGHSNARRRHAPAKHTSGVAHYQDWMTPNPHLNNIRRRLYLILLNHNLTNKKQFNLSIKFSFDFIMVRLILNTTYRERTGRNGEG